VKIVVDTNVLVRVFAKDDEVQHRLANEALEAADAVVITLPTLCELVWVLASGYRLSRAEIATVIRRLIATENAECNQPAVEVGLAVLEAGGDFADGIIAYEGRWLGAESFVSFDRKAVRILEARGEAVRLLA